MELTAENVDKVFKDCLFNNGEDTSNHKIGDGVMLRTGFHPDRLADHRKDIEDMLNQLPEEFKENGPGGGWTFMNAAETNKGVLWGQHDDIDKLVCLGRAISKIKYSMDRRYWSSLPGGVPYFSIVD